MASENGPQDYYPSAKVRLVLRLEEYAQTDVRGQAPPIPLRSAKGSSTVRTTLRVVDDASTGYVRRVLTSGTTPSLSDALKSYASSGTGSDQVSSFDRRTVSVDAIIPKTASWKQGGIQHADKLELTLRWSDFPVDPRAVRSVAVEFYLGTVSPEDFSAGVLGKTRGSEDNSAKNANEPLNLVPDSYEQGGARRTNLRFRGWVDEWELDWGDGEPIVRLECRDMSQVVRDTKMPAKGGLSTKEPIDVAIAKFLAANFPRLDGYTVEFRPPPMSPTTAGHGDQSQAAPAPTLSKVISQSSAQSTSAPAPTLGSLTPAAGNVPGVGSPQHKTGGSDQGQSVWDYLVDNVRSMGLSVRLEDNHIIVEEVRSLIDARRVDDPYVPRELESGRYPVRAMIYGRNILEMKMKRGFARKTPQNVECRSYDHEIKRPRLGRWPGKEKRAATPGPGDGHVEEQWNEILLPGGLSQDAVQRAARNYYEAFSRQELSVSLKTRNLASFGAGNADPDLLDLRPGDTVEVLTDKRGTSTTADVSDRLRTASEYLTRIGYPQAFADQYVSVVQNAGLQTLFIVRTADVDWSADEGVTVGVELVNYVVVRADAGT